LPGLFLISRRENVKRIYKAYIITLILINVMALLSGFALATEDMWTVANRIIVDVYNQIAGISTVLAGLMTAVAVIGAKMSNNQHKTDQAWDWLKRVWLAWAIVNGIGAVIAYVRPLFTGLNTITG
jgi:lysylphosphatidylglycerol synthetase-like protein (DUF2156 family)